MKKKKKGKIIIILLVVVMLAGIGYFIYNNEKAKELARKLEEERIAKLIVDIKEKYNKTVITNKEANLYIKNGEKYKKAGKIGQEVIVTLDDIEIDENSIYFPITSLNEEYYIYYEDVSKYEEEVVVSEFSMRYKKYIPFNKNVVTENVTNIYKDEKLKYSLPISIDTPIIIMETDKYYIDYNDELVYLKADEVKEVKDSNNTSERVAAEIPTIAFHFIYDKAKGQICYESICHSTEQVQAYIDYIKNENYFTITLEEFELWIDRKINLPVRTLAVTLDDGAYAENARDLFTANKVRINMFIVSSWFDPLAFEGEYSGVYSHTFALHETNKCPGWGYQGSGLLCLDHNVLVNDFLESRKRTNNTTAIAYPFYGVNDHTIAALKEAGFTMGFAGRINTCSMRQGGDKFRIPRCTFVNTTSVNYLANTVLRK